MSDLVVKRRAKPDWWPCKSVILVYPAGIKGRERLVPFYHELLEYIPEEVEIIFLIKDEKYTQNIKALQQKIKNPIKTEINPKLHDIWIRDYAPLSVYQDNIQLPVKFNYNPSYVPPSEQKYIQEENKTAEALAKKYISEGLNSLYFNLDMGNLTHNGKDTAIISNQFIADNLGSNFKHELQPILHIFCGFRNLHMVPVEKDDLTGHVDGMCRFVSEKALVIGSYPDGYGYRFMETMAENLTKDLGPEFKIIRLENTCPEGYTQEGIESAYGNHMNFLRLNDRILFPYYSDEVSKQPFEMFVHNLKEACQDIIVIPVKADGLKDLSRFGGVLNCISWQVWKN